MHSYLLRLTLLLRISRVRFIVPWTGLDTIVGQFSRILESLACRSEELISADRGRLRYQLLIVSWTRSSVLELDVFTQVSEILDIGLVHQTFEVATDALRCET